MTLVFNVGSSSLKFKLFDRRFKVVIADEFDRLKDAADFGEAFQKAGRRVEESGVAISKIGHRIVFGGTELLQPTRITGGILDTIKKNCWVSPIHILPEIAVAKLALNEWPAIPQYAVFDSGFFAELPEPAQVFPIPLEFFRQGIKKFGFHGISHSYAIRTAIEELKKKDVPRSPKGGRDRGRQGDLATKIVCLHLGAGSSAVAAIGEQPIDTSMGLTPLGGLMMQTRPGDLDPGVILHLLETKKVTLKKLRKILFEQSGVLGIAGIGDFRDIRALAGIERDGNASSDLPQDEGSKKHATLALEMYIWQVRKIVGGYAAILGGLDALVFTGAIGFGSAVVRDLVCENLRFLGKFKVLAVEPQEELEIAKTIAK